MKGRVVVLGQLRGREAAALIVDGTLEDLAIETAQPGPGALYRATVDRQMKGQGGVFVRLPEGARGFLRQAGGLRPGQSLLVQVSGHAEGGKAIPVTSRILFKSRLAIVTPDAPGLNISRAIRDEGVLDELRALAAAGMADAPESLGLILRTAAGDAPAAEVAEDIAAMRQLAQAVLADSSGAPELLVDAPSPHELAWRDWSSPPPDDWADAGDAFARHGVAEMIDALLSPETPLPGGGSLVIEPTRALIAVDVNTGNDTSPAAGLKANIAAARALPRQLRLRGLGGQVVVDFAPFPKKDRHILDQALRAAFRAEATETTLAGWTPLGNFELQRKRDRAPLAELLADPSPDLPAA
ncbi:ribonuclease E/G [Halodurantibacterium flavum]|uniref:Ribonuclease E/G n=1 Tax=Halodurantibacterium flavum TaxID=1382802 RepID=A0ABW4S1N9_9RHOB